MNGYSDDIQGALHYKADGGFLHLFLRILLLPNASEVFIMRNVITKVIMIIITYIKTSSKSERGNGTDAFAQHVLRSDTARNYRR
jgi:hypothetical protein